MSRESVSSTGDLPARVPAENDCYGVDLRLLPASGIWLHSPASTDRLGARQDKPRSTTATRQQIVQSIVAAVQTVRETGGLAGRMILALLMVRTLRVASFASPSDLGADHSACCFPIRLCQRASARTKRQGSFRAASIRHDPYFGFELAVSLELDHIARV